MASTHPPTLAEESRVKQYPRNFRRQVLLFGIATIMLILSDALPPLTEAAWVALGLLAFIGVWVHEARPRLGLMLLWAAVVMPAVAAVIILPTFGATETFWVLPAAVLGASVPLQTVLRETQSTAGDTQSRAPAGR